MPGVRAVPAGAVSLPGGRASVGRWIVEQHLVLVGSLEPRDVALEIGTGEGSAAEALLQATAPDSLPEDLDGFVQDMELDRSAQCAGTFPQRVALPPSPGTPLDDDDLAEFEEAPGEGPLQVLDPRSDCHVEQVDTQYLHPVIRTEPNAAVLGLQPPRQRRLPRAGEAADDHEPAELPVPVLNHAASMHDRTGVSDPGVIVICILSAPDAEHVTKH
jgi:hypothetical protein